LAVAGRGFAGHRRAILPSVEPSRPTPNPVASYQTHPERGARTNIPFFALYPINQNH